MSGMANERRRFLNICISVAVVILSISMGYLLFIRNIVHNEVEIAGQFSATRRQCIEIARWLIQERGEYGVTQLIYGGDTTANIMRFEFRDVYGHAIVHVLDDKRLYIVSMGPDGIQDVPYNTEPYNPRTDKVNGDIFCYFALEEGRLRLIDPYDK